MRLKIASRKSDLARLQAYEVGRSIQHKNPHVEIEYLFSTSLGDQNLEDPLWKMPEKGVFTADLTEKLKRGECDLVVHSWKDLPTELAPPVLSEIVATLPRADVRDLFLFKKSSLAKASSSNAFLNKEPSQVVIKVFTSSPRRGYNLSDFFKWALPFKCEVEFASVRGNMLTRVQKLIEGDADGLMVAKAAIDRLLSAPGAEFDLPREQLRTALEQCMFMVVPLTASPAAPAQGALAIEILSSRADLRALLKSVNCEKTFREVNFERHIFKSYGGGCHQKIGLTSLEKPYGRVDFGRGEPPNGQSFSYVKLEPKIQRVVSEGKVAKGKVFPVTMKDSSFFRRERLSVDLGLLAGRDLWVARAEAWPDGAPSTMALENRVIWVSGLESWRKLAALGLWITGSNESLGEREPANIETLMNRKLNFLKLTHSAATEIESQMPALATYKLVAVDNPPELAGKTHFFWPSYSVFARALELAPSIINGRHACGPGHSFDLIYAQLRRLLPSETARLDIYISRESWLEQIC